MQDTTTTVQDAQDAALDREAAAALEAKLEEGAPQDAAPTKAAPKAARKPKAAPSEQELERRKAASLAKASKAAKAAPKAASKPKAAPEATATRKAAQDAQSFVSLAAQDAGPVVKLGLAMHKALGGKEGIHNLRRLRMWRESESIFAAFTRGLESGQDSAAMLSAAQRASGWSMPMVKGEALWFGKEGKYAQRWGKALLSRKQLDAVLGRGAPVPAPVPAPKAAPKASKGKAAPKAAQEQRKAS